MRSFHGWRTRLAIVPLGEPPACADVLAPHYRMILAEIGPARRLLAAALRTAFALWLPFRCAQVAVAYRRSLPWTLGAWRYCRASFSDPFEVSLFALSGDDRRTHMRRFELAGVLRRISPASWRPGNALDDKQRFHEHCRRAGLPIPALIWCPDLPRPTDDPGGDLVVKPAGGRSGEGVTLARRRPDGMLALGPRGEPIMFAALLAQVARRRRPAIVTRRVVNHPALAPLALDALATLRLTTCLDERGDSELVTAALRMPGRVGVAIDGMKHGGLVAAVDPASGRLGVARGHRRPSRHRAHPVSGAAIEGVVVPHWAEAVALARSAHDGAFREHVLIGWDVAITPGGAVLIEGNSKPSIILAQMAPRRGIGNQRLGQLLGYHLARVEAALVRPAVDARASAAPG